ncbi:MAG: Asp-tRNA(Asn)/Glu-tRNA(Gln) amidotransferase subunit GatA [Minisyncoccia bacterium]
MENLTITKIVAGIKRKEFSPTEIVNYYLDKIEKEDKNIQAFLNVFKNSAIEKAKEIEKILKENKNSFKLLGVPIAIKDNILVKGFPCTAASKILENYIAPYDATVIKKLKKEGAIIIGKTNLDEFAMGSSTENSAFLKTKNPLDLEKVPGGSSGGSASAVAADLVPASLGSDTGGSIRQPAAFCGIVGLKPTYGAVSRYGLIAFASSLDQIGPLTKNVEDAKIIFDIIKGKDEMDNTSVSFFSKDKILSKNKIKIGIPKEFFGDSLDKNIKIGIENLIKKLEKEKIKFEEISLSHSKYALSCYYILATSEASSNLARYDGIKYGFSVLNDFQKNNKNLMDIYFESRGKGFGKEVKRRIMLGTFSLSSGYYDAYYLKAKKVQFLIKEDFNKIFKMVNFIFSPTSPFFPFKIGEKINNPLSMYLSDIYTVPVNLAELPAISIPLKTQTFNNFPVSLQIISPKFQEESLFNIASFIEKLENE